MGRAYPARPSSMLYPTNEYLNPSTHLVLALRGGAKKHKKKTYTKPKKVRRVLKKIKMKFLHYFDDAGNLVKKQCAECEPGTFMAKMADKYYCGKCQNSFMFGL